MRNSKKNESMSFKTFLTPKPVLCYYDVTKSVNLSVDASQSGLDAVLLQDNQTVAYASKHLTDFLNLKRNTGNSIWMWMLSSVPVWQRNGSRIWSQCTRSNLCQINCKSTTQNSASTSSIAALPPKGEVPEAYHLGNILLEVGPRKTNVHCWCTIQSTPRDHLNHLRVRTWC